MQASTKLAHLRFARRLALVVPFLLVPFHVSPISAQTVRGIVLDNETAELVDQALVKLMGPDGDAVFAQVLTTKGAFVLRTVEPGNYRLVVERLGYATSRTQLFQLVPGEERHVTVRMGHEAIPLEPLTVHVSSTPEPAFLPEIVDRARRGLGEFLLRADLDRRAGESVGQLLASMAGVRMNVTTFGDPLATMSRSTTFGTLGQMWPRPAETREEAYARAVECEPALFFNGSPYYLPRSFDARDEETYRYAPLDLIRSFYQWRGAQIEAIEVYPGPSSLPAEYSGSASRCGAVAIWLRPGG